MSDNQNPQPGIPDAPIPGAPTPDAHIPVAHIPVAQGPQVGVPQTAIPHMGTSHAQVPIPEVPNPTVSDAPIAQPQPANHTISPTVSQEAIDAAIAQVEQTGSTEGIAPEVLGAACAQIEAQAAAQGIDLNQAALDQQAPQQPEPTSYVEAAVMDKKGTIDNFAQQRDSIKDQVKTQREAAQKPYEDALAKANGGTAPGAAPGAAPGPDAQEQAALDEEGMKQLASMLKELDPSTLALINAMGVVSSTPGVMQSILWVEIIRAIRAMISAEAKQQLDQRLKPDAA
ncbi:hypothetical protein ACFL12_05510 [Pseudomonadota bacterium]